MKVSLITVSYNSGKTIQKTLESVAIQTYPDIEHLIIDGCSTDNTVEIVRSFPHVSQCISEEDQGIYDAINKGIERSTGDIIGIINSDDELMHPNTIETVVNAFVNEPSVDSVIGDVIFVPSDSEKVYRKIVPKNWTPDKFVWGFMPPHPTFYVRRELFGIYGNYKIDYTIASDYELLIRFLKVHEVNFTYIPKVLVKMRMGGVSTKNFNSNILLNKEILRACKENGLYTNYFMIYSKYFTKIFELIG